MRVLLIEDNVHDRELTRRELTGAGFEVLEANRADRGLELARENPPQVALVDIGLPGADGYDCARAFKADPDLKHIPVIALTGASIGSFTHARAEGVFDDFLEKPLSTQKLMRALARHRNGGGKRKQLQRTEHWQPPVEDESSSDEIEVKTSVASFRARGTDVIAMVLGAIGVLMIVMLWKLGQDMERSNKSIMDAYGLVTQAIEKQLAGQDKIKKAIDRQTCIMAYEQDRRPRELHNVYSHCNQ